MSSDSNEIGEGLEEANESAGSTTTWAARAYLFLLVLLSVGAVGAGVWFGYLDPGVISEGWSQTAWAWEYLFASIILGIAGLTVIALILAPPDGFWPGFTGAFKHIVHETSFSEFENVEDDE